MSTGFTIDHTTGNLSYAGGTLTLASGAQIEARSQFKVLDGAVSAPSITNYGDENTGLYFPADEQVGLVGSGVEVLRIDGSSHQVTFYPGDSGYTFPASRGTNGQTLVTDGSGNLSWSSPSSGGVTLDDAMKIALFL